MSRRLRALTILAMVSLVAAGSLLPGLATLAGAAPYGSRVFQANPFVVPGAQSYSVYMGSTVAQSFAVGDAYTLQNVTLRVVNNGSATNALVVSIHPDDPIFHVPVMTTTLASWSEVTPNNNPNPVNASWTFSPAPVLASGHTYWIVATNNAPQASNGYQWLSSSGDTYLDGHALLDATGGWSGLPYDLFFITYGQAVDANVTPALTVSPSFAQPGQFVTFTASLNNTGSAAAPSVWVNDTLPASLTNVSLTFPGIQPVSAASFPALRFVNVMNGPHAFTIHAQIAIGTPAGALVTNGVTLTYANATGAIVQAGTVTASVRVGLVTRPLYLGGAPANPLLLTTVRPTRATPQTTTLARSGSVEFVLVPALAQPFDAWSATATLWLGTKAAPPQTYTITLSLLDNAAPVATGTPTFQISAAGLAPHTFTIPLSNYTFGGGDQIGLKIVNQGGSTDSLVVAYNSTLDTSRVDFVTSTYVSIGPLDLENQAGPTSTWSTLDSLRVSANVSDPFGSSRITGVWINITTPSGHLAAAGAMSFVATDPSSLPAWTLFNYSLSPPLFTGEYHVVVTAMEDSGVTSLSEAFADVAVPAFTLTVDPSSIQVVQGQVFAFYLLYNNSGSGPATRAWVNNTFPSGLSYVASNLSVTSVSGSTYTWALTNVSLGSHRLEIDALVTGSALAWVQDEATLEYQDTSGNAFPTLYSNLSAILNGPIVSLSVVGTPSGSIHANESEAYSFALVNSGTAAGVVWVNDTLPAGFAYSSTNADLLGATVTLSGSVVRLAFPEMLPNVTWRFDVIAVAGPVLGRNATYENAVSVAYASLSGELMPPAAATVSVLALSPWILGGTIQFLENSLLPGDNVTALLSFENLGNEAAPNVWANLTLDPRLSITNATQAYTSAGGNVVFALSGIGTGTFTMYVNLSIDPNVSDHGALMVLGTLQGKDGFGNPLPTTSFSPATVFVTAAELSLFFTPVKATLEAGIPYPLDIFGSNWGHDAAANVWFNLTLPPNLAYVNDTSPIPPAVAGLVYTWHWVNLTPGPFAFRVYLQALATVPNGTAIALPLTLEYQGSNGRQRPGLNTAVQVTVVAPAIALTLEAGATNVLSGATLRYTLTMRNAGMTTAEAVYLVDEVDPRLHVITFEAGVAAVITNSTYNWTFADLAPGATVTLNLTVNVAEGVAAGSIIPNVFEATYTNSVGGLLTRVRSAPVIITVVADYTVPLGLGLGLAVAGIVGYAVARQKKVEIEEVFLVYRDGVLISHLSRTLMREKDEDVLSGMLTAVQEFVREAFQYGEHRDLHQMDFGDYRILIERGKYVFLAIVYSGKESASLHKKVRTVINRVEDQFGTALENWDGDMDEVMGARDLIRETLLGSTNRNHATKPVEETD